MVSGTASFPRAKKPHGVWNAVRFLFGILLRLLALILLIILVTPFANFFWHAGQKMALPQFNGLTYYQFMAWEKTAYAQLAGQYDRAHPGGKPVDGQCLAADVVFVPVRYALAGFYALAGIYPGLQNYIDPGDIRDGTVEKGVTWLTFLPTWWDIFEKIVWSGVAAAHHGAASWCHLPLDLPSAVDR